MGCFYIAGSLEMRLPWWRIIQQLTHDKMKHLCVGRYSDVVTVASTYRPALK